MPEGDFPIRSAYQNKKVAEKYDEERFDSLKKKILFYLELRSIKRAIKELPRDSRVLDLPCGTGRVLAPMIKHCEFVQGADISQEMIDVAKNRYKDKSNVSFIQADGTSLPFDDNEFDCVFSMRFFGHTPPDVRLAVMKEMARVTKNRVALMMYVRDPIITVLKQTKWLIKPLKKPWYPIRSRRELKDLFQEAGFTIQEVRRLMPGIMESQLVIATKE